VTTQEAALFSWSLPWLPVTLLLITAGIYLRGWRLLHRQVPLRFPRWRAVCFLGGLTAIFVSMASPLDTFASFLLISHMAQHLLLTMIAPPLIWLGAPQLPMLRGLPKGFVVTVVTPFILWPVMKKIVHGLTHPVVCWSLFVISNVVWHVPALYELALRSRGWHNVEHASFLGTALLYWWPVVQPWPSRTRWPRWTMIPYLLLADLQNTALAAFLTFQDRVLYSTYEAAPRLFGISALDDQAGAGALMWVPGSLAFIIPAGYIAWQFLSPQRTVRPSEHARKPPPQHPAPSLRQNNTPPSTLDLFRVPGLGAVMRWKHFRKSLQILMLSLAALVVADGIRGPQVSALNAAGVLPWTHWRTFTVVALLVAGNLFCMACPFTFVRDLGRKILPASANWPPWLRSKWLAVALLIVYLWAYEAFDLWDRPLATALLILSYFVAALLVDGFFRGASFCQYVCPIGQFHFVQSLVSPFEIKVREPSACLSCKTHDCLRGNESQRGCELHLFQPRKAGNMDCTFCLDCVQACPHDNVGFLAVMPGREVILDEKKSTVGKYARRPDIAALVLVLTFGAFVNAAGMVAPVLEIMDAVTNRWALSSDLLPVSILMGIGLVVLPGLSSLGAAWASGGKKFWKEHLCRFSVALAPLGFGMWLAHFVFHFFTAALTPVPVLGRALEDSGLIGSSTTWVAPSLALYDLPAVEIVLLNAGYLLCLFMLWRIAAKVPGSNARRAFPPWAVIATALYLFGLWIIFQPMEMRGTLMG